MNNLIKDLLYRSVNLSGYKNATIICDTNNNLLSAGYNTFVCGNNRKFSESMNTDFKEKGDKYYVIDAFTHALINLIKVNDNKKTEKLIIYTTNLPNAQTTKILSYFNVSKILNFNLSPFMLFPEITENYDLENDEKNWTIKTIAKEKNIEISNLNIENDKIPLNNDFNLNDFIKKISTPIHNNYCELSFNNDFLFNIQNLFELFDKFSDDKYFQVSACLIDKNFRIINFATNIIPQNTEKTEYKIDKSRKRKFILCAEQVLLMDSIFKNISFNDKIFITNAMPCYMCAKLIVEFGIKNILVFDFDKFEKIDFTDEISEDIFTNANVNYKIIKKVNR